MIQVGIEQATDELAELIDKALEGEQVDIAQRSDRAGSVATNSCYSASSADWWIALVGDRDGG